MTSGTKATLWVATVVLLSYFIWFNVDCWRDPSCHHVFCGKHPCGITRAK